MDYRTPSDSAPNLGRPEPLRWQSGDPFFNLEAGKPQICVASPQQAIRQSRPAEGRKGQGGISECAARPGDFRFDREELARPRILAIEDQIGASGRRGGDAR